MSKKLFYYGSTASFSNLWAIRFDGINEYLSRSGFSIDNYAQFSVAVRFKTSTNQAIKFILSMPYIAGGDGVDIFFKNSTTIAATVSTGIPPPLQVTLEYAVGVYNDNNWHSVILTYDGATAKMYYDGVERDSDSITGTVNTDLNQFNIGRFSSAFGLYAKADIDEPAIWNTALTGAQVTEIYGGNVNLLTHSAGGNLVAWWRNGDDPLDDATGATGSIIDQVGSNDLTPFNTDSSNIVAV